MSERTVRKRRWRWPAPLWITALVATLAMPVMAGVEPASAQSVEQTWVEQDPVKSPPAREGHAMAYHAANDRTLVFGGENASGLLNDTWVKTTNVWSKQTASTSHPAPRKRIGVAYDAARAQTVIFGGNSASGLMDDTWEWNGFSWTKKSPSGTIPPARYGAAMTYDAARQEVVLFGGWDGTSHLDDTWVWDGSTWTQRFPADQPSERWVTEMTYDPLNRQVVLFGGTGPSSSLADTWVWDGSNWTEVTPAAPEPSPQARHAHRMTYDPVRQQVLLFGGRDGTDYFDDTWAWDGEAWEPLAALGPSGRRSPGLAYDLASGEAVLFGGHDGTNYLDDTWTLQAEVETPDPGELLDEVPDPEDLIDDLPDFYPSDDCDGGTNVVSGFFGGEYVKARTAPDPDDPGTTMVCVAADDGEHHLGGRVDVRAGLPGAPVATDDEAEACQAEDGNVTLLSGTVAGGQPVRLDVATVPGDDGDLVWVCTQLTDAVGARLVFSAADATGPGFTPDTTEPHLPYPEEPWPVIGQPSAACDAVGPDGQENHKENHLVNARVGTTFLGLYHAQPGGDSDAHWVCYRAQTSPTEGEGGRITADATPSSGNDATGCTWDVVTTTSPISAGLFLNWNPTQDPLPDSAKVCVTTNDVVFTTVTAETAVPGFEQDTA